MLSIAHDHICDDRLDYSAILLRHSYFLLLTLLTGAISCCSGRCVSGNQFRGDSPRRLGFGCQPKRLFFRMPFLSPKAPRRFASHEQSRKTVRQAHRRKKRRELSPSDATNPELRSTITMCNRHDPNRVSPNHVGNVVRKSVQIYSAISFRP